MAAERPELPPRNATVRPTAAKTLLECPCYSPLALLTQLEQLSSGDHKHVFKSFNIETPEQVVTTTTAEDELVDTENIEPVIALDSENVRFSCSTCHSWLQIIHTPFVEKCSGICHHYHSQGLQTYQCCGCEYSVSFELQEPALSMTLLKRLESTRPKSRSFADLMQQKEQGPTLVSTLSTVLVYINNLLEGSKRNINVNNPHFLARIGLNDGSQALLEEIGFRFEENYFIAPDTTNEERLKQIKQEIILSLDSLRQELGSTTVPFSPAESNIRVKTADMQQLFGIVPTLENRFQATNDYVNQAYAFFGLTSGASDVLVQWTFKKLMNEPSVLMDSFDAMDNLVIIANHTSSVTLQTLVAVERSQGKIGRNDIGDAYAYFGVTEDSADDNLLIGLYQVKVSDDPLEKNTHQEKLKTIAIARNSSELIEFLKKERGITSSNNMSVEEMMGVPSHMINSQQNIPVGLNNIGNTCYFNSVLQYYYTLVPFRDTMVHNESYVEDEHSEPKKIGGIEVDHSEVRRAKKFVGLLKDLFINLQQTHEKAISPQYDLAYMALLNEKDDEEDDKQASTTFDNLQPLGTDSDVEMTDAVSDTENNNDTTTDDNQKDIVENGTDKQPVENGTTHTNGTVTEFPDDIRPDSPPPAYNEVFSKAEQAEHLVTDIKKPIPEPSTSRPVPELPPKTKERPSADTMMFGKQQDVTECMSNVMYLVEAALKPLSKTDDGEQVDDMIRQLFYGKARQIISYCDNKTSKTVKKEMEEDFSHVIVEASESKDLYDGLDEYFCASTLENFQGGNDATREVTVKSFPPVLQILFQRVQFDRATQNIYKSNEYIQFYKTIYLDRYLESNFEELKDRRDQVGNWRNELEESKAKVAKYSKTENLDMSVPKLLEATNKILAQFQADHDGLSEEEKAQFDQVLTILKREATDKQKIIEDGTAKIEELKDKIRNQYNDYTKAEYKLHAVFIHQGQANYGHYWIYILDHREDQWWKFNDSTVTKVQESEIFHDTTGSTANPYFLVYVDAEKINEYVETIVARREIVPVLSN